MTGIKKAAASESLKDSFLDLSKSTPKNTGISTAAHIATVGRDPADTASDTPEMKNMIILAIVFFSMTADNPKKTANPIPAMALLEAI